MMKWAIYVLCLIAIGTIVIFLNYISKGNIVGIGLGNYIIELIGYISISSMLRKHIWK